MFTLEISHKIYIEEFLYAVQVAQMSVVFNFERPKSEVGTLGKDFGNFAREMTWLICHRFFSVVQ